MTDYISREEAIDKMRSLKSSYRAKNAWDSGYDTAIAQAFEYIKRVPVADVQPVKRGLWENTNTPNQLRCSVCEIVHFIAQYPHGDINYCPNCGARMDLECKRRIN